MVQHANHPAREVQDIFLQGVSMETRYNEAMVQEEVRTTSLRINAIDLLRGLIMIMMAFCHTRDYIGADDYENVYWNTNASWSGTLGIDILQQFFTIIVPGGFFMLMGIGIVYFYRSRLKSGWTLEKTMRYLFIRGFVLIALQLTLLQAFEIISQGTVFFYMGVLFALGCCMLVASFVEYLSHRLQRFFILPLFIIIAIIIPQQFAINHIQNQHQLAGFWQSLFMLGGVLQDGIKLDIDFTPLPWIPGVMFGIIIGHLMLNYKNKSMEIIGKLAVIMLSTWVFFVVLDFSMGVKLGDYRAYDSLNQVSMLSYICLSKYPPSINFYLFSCGLNLALMYLLSRCERSTLFCTLFSPIKTIGQCALFFFVLHWFVYYGLSLLTPTDHFSQVEVLLSWLLGILILYPLCKHYSQFKQTQPPESLWRLF